MRERIKTHIKKHQVAYSCGITAVVVAGITALIMRRNQSFGGCGYNQSSGQLVDTGKPQTIISSPFFNSFNTTNNYDRVHPLSYIVSENGTDRWWKSQAEVCRETGISQSNLSKHINHGRHLDEGRSFSRVGIAA